MKSKNLPTISVVIATFNSEKTLKRCLETIRLQKYTQSKIDIILGDGGSTDGTLNIAKKNKANVVAIPTQKQHAEYNRGVAYNKAKGEFVLILDHDNFLPYTDWLNDMIEPLVEHPDMVAVETCYYDYKRSYSALDRYCGLFGTNEPLPFYLGKADRMPITARKWVLQGRAKDFGKYYVVEFNKDPHTFPSIGTNGCLIRRKLVNKFADVRPDHHYPIDVMVDVLMSGHNKFGFVKNSIIHLQQSKGLIDFLKRRQRFVEQYHFRESSKRRWSVYMPQDKWRLILYIIYSLTLVKPTFDAFRGFLKIRDYAWFIHPIMAFVTTVMYGYATIKYELKV